MYLIRSAFRKSIVASISHYLDQYLQRADLWSTVSSRWESELYKGYRAEQISVVDLGQGLTQQAVNEVFRNLPILRIQGNQVRYQSQFCCFRQGSGMNPHCDSRYIWAATLYLNSVWDRLGGGWFCCDQFVHIPEYNSLVVNSSKDSHFVSEVYSNVPRLTMQIWAYS